MKLEIPRIVCCVFSAILVGGCSPGTRGATVNDPSQSAKDDMATIRQKLVCGTLEERCSARLTLAKKGDASRNNFEAFLADFRTGNPNRGFPFYIDQLGCYAPYAMWAWRHKGNLGYLEPDTKSTDEHRRFLAKRCLWRLKPAFQSPSYAMRFIGKAYYIGNVTDRFHKLGAPPGFRFEDLWEVALAEVVYPEKKTMTLTELCELISAATNRTIVWCPELPAKTANKPFDWREFYGDTLRERKGTAARALLLAILRAERIYTTSKWTRRGLIPAEVMAIPTPTRILMVVVPAELARNER